MSGREYKLERTVCDKGGQHSDRLEEIDTSQITKLDSVAETSGGPISSVSSSLLVPIS